MAVETGNVEIEEDQGWRVCRFVNDCEARGICPDHKEVLRWANGR